MIIILKSFREVRGFSWLSDLDTVEGYDYLFPYRPAWMIDKIFVPPNCRGRHYGKALLDKICCQADQQHVALYLGVSPDDDCPMTEAQLVGFYETYEFKINPEYPQLMMRRAK